MNTIRIRKAKSGNGFKFKFRFMEEKRDLNASEARAFVGLKTTVFEPSKNLTQHDFDLAQDYLATVKPSKVAKKAAVVQQPARMLRPKTPNAKVVVEHKTGFSVHSRVGLQKVLEGESLILAELKKAAKPLTASEIGKRIFRNELNRRSVEFVVEVRGFKFYAYLNKHYTPMVRKEMIKCVGLDKGHRKMEKLWEALDV